MKSRKSCFVNIGGIVFNIDDERQKIMYDHVKKQSNFSSYMKSLIWMDISGQYNTTVPLPPTKEIGPAPIQSAPDHDIFKSFL